MQVLNNNENSQTFGHVVVIRRDGQDGGKFPVNRDIMIGRHEDCHIRISLSTVSRRHTLIRINEDDGKVYLRNMSMTNPTNLNNKNVSGADMCLGHKDVLKVGERQFRWEYTPEFLQKFNKTMIQKSVVEEQKRALTTPIRNDIKKRRLSTPALRVPIDDSVSNDAEEEEVVEEEEDSNSGAGDDMMDINTFDLENVQNDEENDEEFATTGKRSLPTPIREQIQVQHTPTPAKGYENTVEFSTSKKQKEPKSWTPACEGMGRLFLTPQVTSTTTATTENNNDIVESSVAPIVEEQEEAEVEVEEVVEQENGQPVETEVNVQEEQKEIVQEKNEEEDDEEERFAKQEDFEFNVDFNMSCKKNDIIEALDFEDDENCYFFFNAIVVGRPTKSKGVPIKFLDDEGNPTGRKRNTKFVRALVNNNAEDIVEEEEETEVEVQDFSKLRVVDLRAELKKLGLSTKGRKAELVERLTEASCK